MEQQPYHELFCPRHPYGLILGGIRSYCRSGNYQHVSGQCSKRRRWQNSGLHSGTERRNAPARGKAQYTANKNRREWLRLAQSAKGRSYQRIYPSPLAMEEMSIIDLLSEIPDEDSQFVGSVKDRIYMPAEFFQRWIRPTIERIAI